jgi:hypothetical protein
METTTMRGVILRMRMGSMRMGQETRVIGQPRTPNGDRLSVFTVGGHAQCSNIIPIPNGDTQGVAQDFLKYHTDLNVRIRALKVVL